MAKHGNASLRQIYKKNMIIGFNRCTYQLIISFHSIYRSSYTLHIVLFCPKTAKTLVIFSHKDYQNAVATRVHSISQLKPYKVNGYTGILMQIPKILISIRYIKIPYILYSTTNPGQPMAAKSQNIIFRSRYELISLSKDFFNLFSTITRQVS